MMLICFLSTLFFVQGLKLCVTDIAGNEKVVIEVCNNWYEKVMHHHKYEKVMHHHKGVVMES